MSRIHEVCFYSLASSTWDDVSLQPPDALDNEIVGDYGATNNPQMYEHPCAPLTKILSSGTFYYTLESEWDLSSRLSVRLARQGEGGAAPPEGKNDVEVFDERFVWNEYIIRSLLDFRDRLDVKERAELDSCHFIVSLSGILHGQSHMLCTGAGHTRLRWSILYEFDGPTYELESISRNTFTHFTSGMETGWYAVQYQGCR